MSQYPNQTKSEHLSRLLAREKKGRKLIHDRIKSGRARIEHLFTRIDRFHILHDNAHDFSFLKKAFELIMTVQHIVTRNSAASTLTRKH